MKKILILGESLDVYKSAKKNYINMLNEKN